MLKSSGFFRFKDLGFRVPVGVYWLIRGPVQRGSIKREREIHIYKYMYIDHHYGTRPLKPQ